MDRIRAFEGRAHFAHLEVSRADEVKQILQRTIDKLGDLQILFNGAGILAYGTVLETTEEAWQRMMGVNLTGAFLCSKAVLEYMVTKRHRAIINDASTTGSHDACGHAAAYVTSKRRSHPADEIHSDRLRKARHPRQRNLSRSHRHAHVAQRVDGRGTRSTCGDISHE